MMPEDRQGNTGVLTRLFHHNTWANLKLLDFCGGLSDEQLDASAIGCYGSIRDTLLHFIGGEVDYVNLANDKLLPPVPLPSDDFPAFEVLEEGARWAGDVLLKLAILAQLDS